MSSPKSAGLFRRLLKKIAAPASKQDEQQLTEQSQRSSCMQISQCKDRQLALLRGTLVTVVVSSGCGNIALEAELSDGTGSVRLIWLGRRIIPGISAGRSLYVSGRLSFVDGKRIIYNPKYELL